MLTRLLATAFKSNSRTWNSICFSYVDMDMKTCKFKESGQFYYSVTRENTGLMLFINTNCWLSCWDPWKTERRAITCLSSTGVPPNWCRNVGSRLFTFLCIWLWKWARFKTHRHYFPFTLTRRHYLYHSSQKEKMTAISTTQDERAEKEELPGTQTCSDSVGVQAITPA